MLKLTLRVFLILLVDKNVLSLKCYVTDASKCPVKNIHAQFYQCLSNHYESRECESPKMCFEADIIDRQTHDMVYLRGCVSPNDDCKEILIKPILGNETGYTLCSPCSYPDNCNIKRKLWGSKSNSTTAAPKKSEGRSNSSPNKNNASYMSIFVHILLLLFPFF